MKKQVKKILNEQDRQWWINFINNLVFEVRKDGSFTKPKMLSIYDVPKKRNLSQNGLYHMWKAVIADELGYHTDVLHEILKGEYLGYEIMVYKGKEHKIPISTTSLSEREFSEFVTRIHADFSAQGIILPHPGDRGFDEMFEMYRNKK